jgi:RHH-type transcriptional regulator, proline utilization regulon repressor / proline dehydrogenase / delta 1-pyrroline-5-carboxylate dehydrogenase
MRGDLIRLRAAIDALHEVDELELVQTLLHQAAGQEARFPVIAQRAAQAVAAFREQHRREFGVNQLMREYRLSSAEGVALMCLAEALLRIPDVHTRDQLIQDKLGHADWHKHLWHSGSLFVNAGSRGLFIAGSVVQVPSEESLWTTLKQWVKRSGEPVVRQAVELAVRYMGKQFVMEQTIEAALEHSASKVAQGYTFSFDMLGEAARCAADAQRYFNQYVHAINTVGQAHTAGTVEQGQGVSVKLSALHPRYSVWQADRVHAELYPRLLHLATLAARHNIGLTIDAEESERLALSLDLLERLAFEPVLANWSGLGLAVQAYQTRAVAVVRYLTELARLCQRRIMVRLVKGAYWDTEIKQAQLQGLSGFPVFTHKAHTDLSYLVCAQHLLEHADHVYPQFATHNAHTAAAVQDMASQCGVSRYEMQCLHGMGQGLYSRCRIYAPVGTHETLLPYLVRRLLENGANTSFVNQLADTNPDLQSLIEHPVQRLMRLGLRANRHCVPAPALFGPQRVNSAGLNLYARPVLDRLLQGVASPPETLAQPVHWATQAAVQRALKMAHDSAPQWLALGPAHWQQCMLKAGDLLEQHRTALLQLLVHEAGKTLPNALGEVREAVDFCRYYAQQLGRLSLHPLPLQPKVAVCISPWNFPLAIFLGQMLGALGSGHAVVAKPAEQTPQVARYTTALLHESGVPENVLHCLFGDAQVGAWLTESPLVNTVLFTGSNAAAHHIQANLLRQPRDGFPPVLLAETGGQNAMVVDSSALPEQVVADVLESAFGSAGQRCSALRVLCIQSDVADAIIALLKGAMDELNVGLPQRMDTDLGPLIDSPAKALVLAHIQAMRARGFKVYEGGRVAVDLPLGDEANLHVQPTLIEIEQMDDLGPEVFGPVLHVLRYQAKQLAQLLEQINSTGFALTFGVHSRVQSTIDYASTHSRAGNVYVNRNMVGAIVGSQPFGGTGKSGTGPKAGGPNYLPHLMRLPQHPLLLEKDLPGPTGEANSYQWSSRGQVWCTATSPTVLREQCEAVAHAGNTAVVEARQLPGMMEWFDALPSGLASNVQVVHRAHLAHIALAVCEHSSTRAWALARQLADCTSHLVPLVLQNADGSYPAYQLVRERVVSVNTAAIGGNADLMGQG